MVRDSGQFRPASFDVGVQIVRQSTWVVRGKATPANHSRNAAAQTRWDTLTRNCILNGNRPLPDP